MVESSDVDRKVETHQQQLLRFLGNFFVALQNYPGWLEWQRQKIEYTLYFDDPFMHNTTIPTNREFKLVKKIRDQHAVAVEYFALIDSIQALKECEYYFRRFPFSGLPIDRHRHIVLICEMYFSRFYEIRCRIKNLLNSSKTISKSNSIDVSAFLKVYDNLFDREIRARNGIHHRERFDDLTMNRIFLQETLLQEAPPHELDQSLVRRIRLSRYRRLTREWVRRVRGRGSIMEKFLELIAKEIVQNCNFITDPMEIVELTTVETRSSGG